MGTNATPGKKAENKAAWMKLITGCIVCTRNMRGRKIASYKQCIQAMPSVYVCVTYTDPGGIKYFLIAKKNTAARWHQWGAAAGSAIANNPGQHVFPGGELGPGEDARAGAVREFREQTGVDLSSFSSVTAPVSTQYNTEVFDLGQQEFYFVHGCAAILLAQNNQRINGWQVVMTEDDQLQGVSMLTAPAAEGQFKADDNAGNPRARTSWFTEIVEYVTTH